MSRSVRAPLRRYLAVGLNALPTLTLLYLLVRVLTLGSRSAFILGLAIILLAATLLAGLITLGSWRANRWAAFLALFFQGCQVLQVENPHLTYRTSLPVAVVVGAAEHSRPYLDVTWHPRITLASDSDTTIDLLGINLLALAAAWLSLRILLRRPTAGPRGETGAGST
jgi:hypothetical protein